MSFLRRVFLDQVIHFGKNLGDQVKGHSPKELKSLIEVPYVVLLNVQALSFNVNLSLFRSVFLDRVSQFGKNLGDHGKYRSPKKLKSLIEAPYVVHVKVHVLGPYTEKAKIVDRCSLCSAHESTGSMLQHEPYLFSVACSKTKLSISVKNWVIR